MALIALLLTAGVVARAGAAAGARECSWEPLSQAETKLGIKLLARGAMSLSKGSGGSADCDYWSSTGGWVELRTQYFAYAAPGEDAAQLASDCHGRSVTVTGFPGRAWAVLCKARISLWIVSHYAYFDIVQNTSGYTPPPANAPKPASEAQVVSVAHLVFPRVVQLVYPFR